MEGFEKYQVSEDYGFLVKQNLLVTLPEYYQSWVQLKTNLEDLMVNRRLDEYVKEMPVLSLDYLETDEERQYCRSILAMITTAFVWHQRDIYIPRILPKSLAIPLMELSDYFGLIPILTHTDLVILNTIIDVPQEGDDKSSRGLLMREQIVSNHNWTVFQRETARVELCFAPAISAIRRICNSLETDDIDETIAALQIISEVVNSMHQSMKTFQEMDPDYFHLEMRPFLVGWSGESFPYPEGLLYENEDGTFTPQECIGASAAQSPTLQALDSLFKIEHSTDNQKFFDSMKKYMLRTHREFLKDIKEKIHLDQFVQRNSNNPVLIETYNQCLAAISKYRTGHMQTVTKFIINPAKKVDNNSSQSEFLQRKGTGGQDLIKFLKEIRDDVHQQKK